MAQVVNVRYIVDDVDASIEFYEGTLGFELEARMGPGFGIVKLGNLRLLLSGAGGGGGAAQAMPDGSVPEPGGWNRIQLDIGDLASEVERLRGLGVRFRGEIIEGRGGSQILLEDPSGNAVELFQPRSA